ncbi:universal stress protein [Aliamphritea spongicola]|nr:universal stress protein [Aliamphritea spongicola]
MYEGSPAEMIIRYIRKKEIDLVVMSAHHRSRMNEFLLGSVSARVAERAGCSVMLLKN